MLREILRLLLDVLSFITERSHDGRQHILPGRTVVNGARRKISPPIKRLGLRREKYIQWPASAAGNGLHRLHIYMIEVGPLLSVDLDIDEVFIHKGSRFRMLDTFPLHHMTPVTGRIANADQDGLVFLPGLLQCFIPPWIPIYGVMGMLQ